MDQLFSNIFLNAIKYRRPDVKPVIKIMGDVVSAEEIPGLTNAISEKYYQISVTDNGIGFAPEFSEHIFGMFHRLHGKSEYPGTGLGLSICKKIVSIHQGFIEAVGHPEEGSSFILYLPVA